MNIIQLLKKDHNELKEVMEQLDQNANNNLERHQASVEKLFDKFKELFATHDKTEDKIVYPCLKKIKELHYLALKGYEAHHTVEIGILELKLLPYTSESWGPKFSVIRDSILMHMHEEEKELFPEMEKYIDKDILKDLAEQTEDQRSSVFN